jgi:hypothetical protein
MAFWYNLFQVIGLHQIMLQLFEFLSFLNQMDGSLDD